MRRRTQHLKPLITLYNLILDSGKLIWFALLDRLALLGRRNPAPAAPAVIVVRLDAIGDYLLFRPFLEQLKQSERFKGRELVLCGNIAWRELAEQFDAATVDRFIWLDRKKFGRNPLYRVRKLKELSATAYETAVCPTFSRDLFYADRVMKIIYAQEKIGSTGDPGIVGGWRRKVGDRAYTKLLEATPAPAFELFRNQEFLQNLLKTQAAIPASLLPPSPRESRHRLPERYALLFIGASASYKKWPPSCFQEVGICLQQKYHLEIVVCGDPQDEAVGRQMEAENGFISLIGQTTLTDLLTIVARSAIMISNETMPPHLAGLAGHPPCVVVSCSGCFGRFFPYPESITRQYHIVYHPEITADIEQFRKISNQYGFHNTLDISVIKPEQVIAECERAINK